MDIEEFFQRCAGKWFTQRTSHNLTQQKSESDKVTIVAEMVQKDAPDAIALCQQHQLDPACIVGGLRIAPDAPKVETRPRFGRAVPESSGGDDTTLLVLVADAGNPHVGKVLRSNATKKRSSVPSHYVLGGDDSLTLTTVEDSQQMEERLWFASDNLRMRTSLLKQDDGVCIASFFSEIRLGSPPPAEPDS